MARSDVDTDVARLEAQIAQLREDMARVIETLGELGRDGRESLKAKASEKAEDLRDQGAAEFAKASESAEAAFAEVTGYARDKPMQSLAIAAGAGLLLGLLFGRR